MDHTPTLREQVVALEATMARLVSYLAEEKLRTLDSEDNLTFVAKLNF